MALNNPYAKYQENSVFTATPEELTLMLYNGLVKFIMKAQQSIEKKDIPHANEEIIKAQNIVTELRSSLDLKYDISKQLDALYDFMFFWLIEANVKKDIKKLEEVLVIAKDLRDTWTEAMKLAKSSQKLRK
jgi:flagellar biosynthetic protein FliS